MALSAGESFTGGQVRDTQSRSVVISETTDAAITAGEFYSGGFLCDPDSRTVICQDAAHSALTANEQYTSGDVRDKAGRLVCAAETVNSAISAGSQFSGGWLRDSRGRRIIALDTLGSALSAGEQFTAGQIRDSVGRLVLATESAGGSAYDAAVLADSPRGFWPLNELSGTTAFDKSTNANNGTYSAGVTLGQTGIGDGGTAVLFSAAANAGNGCQVSIPDLLALRLTSPMTLEAWAKPTTITTAYSYFSKEAGVGGAGYTLIQASSAFVVATSDGAQSVGSAATTAWNHVVMTWNGTVNLYYLGGVVVTTNSSWSASPTAGTGGFLIGARAGFTNPFDGLLAKVAVYNTVLSPARIAAHFAAG